MITACLMKNRNQLLVFLLFSSICMHAFSQSNLTANLVVDPGFENSVTNAVGNFDAPSVGKWSFFKCENTIQASASQSAQSFAGAKSALVSVTSNPSNTIWDALLYQDFENLLPMKYELTFRAKAGMALQSGVNISVIDKSTNTILKGYSEECFKFNADWGVYVVDFDLSVFKSTDLTNARLLFHFSEVADCMIDEVKMRPIYTVPFVNSSSVALNSAGYLGFDKTPNEFWGGPMAPSATVAPATFSTESTEAPFTVVGNITSNGALLRYSVFPSRGAKPLQGNRSLFVDVQEIYGTPDYEVGLQTPNFASEVTGRKIRISYWAKTDGAVTGEIRIQARFAGTTKDVAQLTPEWKYFSYDYTVPTTTLPYIRLQFYKVGAYHVDWFNVEYVDVSTGVSTPVQNRINFAQLEGNALHIISDDARTAEVFDIAGQKLKEIHCSQNALYEIASRPGIYLIKISGQNNQMQMLKTCIK